MNYVKKYRYSGNFSADIGTAVRGIKGLDDYGKQVPTELRGDILRIPNQIRFLIFLRR